MYPRRSTFRSSISDFRSHGGLFSVIPIFIGIVFVLVIGGLVVNVAAATSASETVTIIVNDKERVTDSDVDGNAYSYYLVFTDKETFKNTDSILHGKFRSSDLYGKLERGQTYNCKVNGYRIPFMSQYRNLLECTKAA